MVPRPPRRLIVLRHAKSAWPEVEDHERPLAARGRRDAPAAGRWLHDAGCAPDRVICSPARRARETWELAVRELGALPEVVLDERVYGAGGEELLAVLREVPPGVQSVLLVGHCPGVQELTLTLADEAVGDALARAAGKFATSAIALLALRDPWPELVRGSGLLTDFAVPRGVKGGTALPKHRPAAGGR